jgi:ribosomal protein S12 methylthiotransferase accessory factor
LPAVELELDPSTGVAAAIAAHYSLLGVRLRAFVLPTDLPATVVLALATEDRPGVPATVVGMGCHTSPLAALTKAVFELCQARPAEASRYRESSPEGRLKTYEDVWTLDDHSAFAALPERRGEFAFLSAEGRSATLDELPSTSEGDVEADLLRCAAALREAGHRVAYADLTTSDVEPLGYRVVRVIVTGLQPIHFGFGNERLGGTRLYELPRRLGLRSEASTPAELNPCPHPMA